MNRCKVSLVKSEKRDAMSLYAIVFYLLSALILVATILAVTRRNIVHAVVYLVFSFFGSAMMFYLFGAPLLAALEVIIYAGAVMVLFLFIVMMLDTEGLEERFFPMGQLLPAAAIAVIYGAIGIAMILTGSGSNAPLKAAVAEPSRFGEYLFRNHWLAIEIVSLLLLVALVGALYLGKHRRNISGEEAEEKP